MSGTAEEDAVAAQQQQAPHRPVVRTKHHTSFALTGADRAVRVCPESLRLSLQSDIAAGCHLPIHCVADIHITADASSLRASYMCSHPLTLTLADIEARVSSAPMLSVRHAIEQSKKGVPMPCSLDAAVHDLCSALRIGEPGDRSGLTLTEVVERCRSLTDSQHDCATYESEISDLLSVIAGLNNEVHMLQTEVDKSNEELERTQQMQIQSECSVSSMAEKAQVEIVRLREIIAALQQLITDGSDRSRMRSIMEEWCGSGCGGTGGESINEGNSINEAPRTPMSVAAPFSGAAPRRLSDSIYTITLEEYNAMKERVEQLLDRLREESAVTEEVRQQAGQLAEELRRSDERVGELTCMIDFMQKAADEGQALQAEKVLFLQGRYTESERRHAAVLEKVAALDASLAASHEHASALEARLDEARAQVALWRQGAARVSARVMGSRDSAEREFDLALSDEANGRNGVYGCLRDKDRAEALAAVTPDEAGISSSNASSPVAFREAILSAWRTLETEVIAFRRRRLMALEERASHTAATTMHLIDKSTLPSMKDDLSGVVLDSTDAVSPDTIFSEPLLAYTSSELLRWHQLCDDMVRQLDVVHTRAELACEARTDAAARQLVFAELERLSEVLVSVQAEGFPEARPVQNLTHLLRIVFADEAQSHVDPVHGTIAEAYHRSGLPSDAWATDDSAAKVTHLADALSAVRLSEASLQAEVTAANAEIEELRTCLARCAEGEGILTAVAAALEVKDLVKDETPPSSYVLDKVVALQSEANTLRTVNAMLKGSVATHQRDAASLRQRIDELNAMVQQLTEGMKEQIAVHDEMVGQLQSYVNDGHAASKVKKLLHMLKLKEQDVFELTAARAGESEEHETQLGILQSHVERLRAQLDNNVFMRNSIPEELQRLQAEVQALSDELTRKDGEVAELRSAIDEMTEEHDKQVNEFEVMLESRSKDASDALARLEEMTAMLKDAREGEESALKLRMKSDAEVLQLQKLFDHVKPTPNIKDANTKMTEKAAPTRLPKTKKRSSSSRVRVC